MPKRQKTEKQTCKETPPHKKHVNVCAAVEKHVWFLSGKSCDKLCDNLSTNPQQSTSTFTTLDAWDQLLDCQISSF